MQNAQDLLDSFGSPPAEVCIDWAWQIVSLAEAGMLPNQFSWLDLQVSKSGKLAFRADCDAKNRRLATATNQSSSFQACVRQLVQWSGANLQVSDGNSLDESSPDASSLFESLKNLQSLLRQLAKEQPNKPASATADLRQSSVLAGEQLSNPNGGEEAISTLVSTTINPSDSVSENLSEESEPSSNTISKSLKAESASINLYKRESKGSYARVLLYAGAPAAVLMLVIGGWWMFGSKDKSKGLAKADNGDRTSTSKNADGSTKNSSGKLSSSNSSSRSKKSTQSNTSELDQLLGGSPNTSASSSDKVGELSASATNNSSTSHASLLESSGQSLPTTPDPLKELNLLDVKPSIDGLLASDSASAKESKPAQASTNKAEEQTASATRSSNATSTESASTPDKPTSLNTADAQRLKLDVASETSQDSVAKLLANSASSASTDAKANSMNNVADNSAQSAAAYLLNVEDLVQIQEIPDKVRVREPAWELRLSSTSTMDVEPSGVQTLAEKSAVLWILSSRELKPRKNQEPTKVAVIAEIANRRGDIRWTIVAGTLDLPNLRFPMNQERLDQLLTILQNYQQRLNVSIDQIKAAMELPDFPKELKSYWTAQRRTFENEVKLTTRARQVVADASMLTSWMDRTIEVHGRLIDTVANKNEAVLEFGQPKVSQAGATAASKKDADKNDSSNDEQKVPK
ncbi:MAG: hypothetical protein U0930_10430 [Pirellulales bacterium]